MNILDMLKARVSGPWTWLRFATVVGGVGAGVLAVLVPPTAPYALPGAALLMGAALTPPGSAPKP